jgi:hypothetical protein
VLTLTTCTPKYSAAQRLIVKAQMVIDQAPLPAPRSAPGPGTRSVPVLADEGLSGDPGSKLPALAMGFVVALIGSLWWLVFHWYPRFTTWFAGALPFSVGLFFFYVFVERLLPTNY